jgi:cyclic pyranopterin phosphate synthase
MVDVSAKAVTARRAVAEATVAMSHETLSLVIDGGGAKGDVLGVAELAGVMGGKRTSELDPALPPAGR